VYDDGYNILNSVFVQIQCLLTLGQTRMLFKACMFKNRMHFSAETPELTK